MVDKVGKATRKASSTFAYFFQRLNQTDSKQDENPVFLSSIRNKPSAADSPASNKTLLISTVSETNTQETITSTIELTLSEDSVEVLLAKCKQMHNAYYTVSSCQFSLMLIEKTFVFLDKMPISTAENEATYINARKIIKDLRKITEEIAALPKPNYSSAVANYMEQLRRFQKDIHDKMEEFGPDKLPIIQDERLWLLAQLYNGYLEIQASMYVLDQNNQVISDNQIERKKAKTLFILLEKRIKNFSRKFGAEYLCSANDVLYALKKYEARILHCHATEIYEEDTRGMDLQRSREHLKKLSLICLEKMLLCPKKYVPVFNEKAVRDALEDALSYYCRREWILIQHNSIEREALAQFAFSSEVIDYIDKPNDSTKRTLCLQKLHEALSAYEEKEEEDSQSVISDVSDPDLPPQHSCLSAIRFLWNSSKKVVPQEIYIESSQNNISRRR